MAHSRFRFTGWVIGASGLAATLALAASGVAANATATGQHAFRVHRAYSCRFSSGPSKVGVTVAATFPTSAAIGKPIQPTGLRTTVTLPHAALADLTKGGATQVTGSDVLSTMVGSGPGASTTTQWPGQMTKRVPIPATGSLPLSFPGQVPPVVARTPASVTFTAGGLTLALVPSKGGADGATSGTVQVACTLNPGQHATLATVPIFNAVASPSVSPSSSHTGTAGRSVTGSATPSISGRVPPGCLKRLIKGGTSSPTLGCAHLIGYADVNKLHGAALVGRGPNGTPPAAFLHTDTYATDSGCVPAEPTPAKCLSSHGALHVYLCTAAQLDFHKQLAFPPAQATFLNFGFVPVTAVVELSETAWPSNHPPVEDPRCFKGFSPSKPVTLHSPLISVFTNANNSVASQPIVNTGTTFLSLHVSQVAVNGVPLPVGPNCGTAQPMLTVLTGHGTNVPVTGYTLPTGGPLTGEVMIPSFVNCGVGENLDPLLNASIAGPANFQLITQGTLCTPQELNFCPPTIPKPRRHVGRQ